MIRVSSSQINGANGKCWLHDLTYKQDPAILAAELNRIPNGRSVPSGLALAVVAVYQILNHGREETFTVGDEKIERSQLHFAFGAVRPTLEMIKHDTDQYVLVKPKDSDRSINWYSMEKPPPQNKIN